MAAADQIRNPTKNQKNQKTMTTNLPTYTVRLHGADVTFTSGFETLADAYRFLDGRSGLSDFAVDLMAAARGRRLSPAQAAWLHKIATDLKTPAARHLGKAVDGLDLRPLLDLLNDAAAAGKKHPKIAIPLADGRVVNVALNTNRPPVVAYIKTGRWPADTLHARVDDAGRVYGTADLREEVIVALAAVVANPVHALAQHGIATGTCCFCSRELTTAESRGAGYGPICADKFRLPWGDTTAADAADAAAKAALAAVAAGEVRQ